MFKRLREKYAADLDGEHNPYTLWATKYAPEVKPYHEIGVYTNLTSWSVGLTAEGWPPVNRYEPGRRFVTASLGPWNLVYSRERNYGT